jgi:hypothetical protein
MNKNFIQANVIYESKLGKGSENQASAGIKRKHSQHLKNIINCHCMLFKQIYLTK